LAKQVETAGKAASKADAIAAPLPQELPSESDSATGFDQSDIDALLAAAGHAPSSEVVGSSLSPDTTPTATDSNGSSAGPQVQHFDFPTFDTQSKAVVDPKRVSMLSDVNLRVKIELGRTRMLVEDVLKLSEGSVVELDKLAGDPVDVYANDRLVARGEVLVLDDSFCVRISDVVSRDPHRIIR
jgi:flagellar motor switch protein FliN/FliY